MTRPNTREKILDAGLETLHRHGFNGCAVQDITTAAGVPKGSFYNHFESKEALGAEVLDRYWAERTATTLRILGDEGLSPITRLERYFTTAAAGLASRGYTCGCLI